MNYEEQARAIVDKFTMDTKDSPYTVIEGDDGTQLVIDIATALRAAKAEGLEEAANIIRRMPAQDDGQRRLIIALLRDIFKAKEAQR